MGWNYFSKRINFNEMTVALFIWAAIQSFIFGSHVLVFKRNKANLFLGSFFILTSINIFLQYLSRYTSWKFEVPEILFISDIISFLYGPVLFLYARQLFFKNFKTVSYFHFLPALVFAVFFSIHEFIINAPFIFFDYIDTTFQRIVLLLIFISNFTYFMLFIHIAGKYKYIKRQSGFWVTGWLSFLYLFFALKVFTGLIFFVYHSMVQPIYNDEIASKFRLFSEYVFIVINAIIIIITSYWSLKGSFQVYSLTESDMNDIIKQPSVEIIPPNVTVSDKIAIGNDNRFRIPANEVDEKIDLLNQLIAKNVHLDAGLNEQKLARQMNVPLHYLSNLLNEHVKESFTEFINRNRIETAKQKLLDKSSANFTIFAIALDCGYNSEPTFYTNFKKYTGTTPKNFKLKALK